MATTNFILFIGIGYKQTRKYRDIRLLLTLSCLLVQDIYRFANAPYTRPLKLVLIQIQPDDQVYTFDNTFAQDFVKSLLSITLPSQVAPVQYYACYSAIITTSCNVNLSKVRAAKKNCQLYALLLYILKRYYNDNKLYI